MNAITAEVSEGQVTILLDGEPLLGVDLEGGSLGWWPNGSEWETIATLPAALNVSAPRDEA